MVMVMVAEIYWPLLNESDNGMGLLIFICILNYVIRILCFFVDCWTNLLNVIWFGREDTKTIRMFVPMDFAPRL